MHRLAPPRKASGDRRPDIRQQRFHSPATIINAQIDPLRSDGETYADELTAAGVETEQMTYDGVAHEFFGMGAVVPQAKEAMTMATERLAAAFAGASNETTSSTGEAAPTPTPAPAQ